MKKINKLSDLIDFHKNNNKNILYLLQPEYININLKGNTKETAVNELLDILQTNGKLLDRAAALKDLIDREQTMSTAIPNGIAIPHAKTNAVQKLTIAIGIKKSGLDFDSPLEDKTRIIILALAPPNKAKPLYEFLLAITTVLNDDTLRSKILAAKTPEEVVELLQRYSEYHINKDEKTKNQR
jgi:mannitol/fructose-specific phosphotransferase system IIA component (Ntr-type)